MGHVYAASSERYSKMVYNPCGKSGLKLPLVSLGLWHNFGNTDCYVTARRMVETAFDAGITHFDLANNYGPEPGSAEITFGQIMKESMAPYRDEMIISTKAGYGMWPGPYGDHGSRKYLIASCDQSLKRMGLDYVDIFYHHRPDPETPIEESMLALDHIVRSGRALYVGISNYGPEATKAAVEVLRANKTPFVIQQMRFNMLDRTHERNGLFNYLADEGIGGIVFSPLAQGLLTNRYLNGIPTDSRASKERFLKSSSITPELLMRIRGLDAIASKRGQTLAQMAIAWILQIRGITSALIGASRPEQILDVVAGLEKREFSAEELSAIDAILK
ncbi:MAG: aldo/keto reductase [Victivallales bacterium]|nr:aldo/keto reductase [Victivallales bacterium]